jgi:integrase/recombinase XerD
MSTVKLELFKGKKLKDSRHPIMIRVTHERKNFYVNTGFSSFPEEWDSKASKFTDQYIKAFKLTKPKFEQIEISLTNKLMDVKTVCLKLEEEKRPYSFEELTKIVKNTNIKTSFYTLTEQVIAQNMKAGKIGNASNYSTILSVVKSFQDQKELFFEQIDHNWLKRFETWHLSKGNSIGGLNVYLRAIRAVFNTAIKEKLIKSEFYPFGKGNFEIPSAPTQKRAISKDSIKQIKKLKLPENSPEWHARNYFLFSFYCRGMNFVDMAHIKKSNIINERVEYIRRKTMRKNAKSFSISMTPQIAQIIDLYAAHKEQDEYIFPIIDRADNPVDTRKDIQNKLKVFNKYMNKIAKMIGIDGNLTSYTARHSWGTAAKKMGIGIAIISDGYGHADMAITQTYLDSIENSELDKANKKITAL